ncbi:hypothetical protein [Leeuwenhoekiella marinoflava]|uniref:Uncharacterized protein n=2 Tax=Leeuwenhoekiella marinoflava TaxID=988 RepID=A0A4Q0PQA5_9FLAO|nr:hypothetical protein [Leeuwenhoekiella marinoflava]RXG32025.1 hypothetical protein DSL99_1330 [Leeuwenhoekiella marinoflava]SHE95397.1 hypothetical protein SAMN02745246_01386 [Leeuwenhoekiella marinoflava DSM 3653]
MNEPKFKKGDQVVMHSCIEANNPKNYGRIFTCSADSKKQLGNEVVFLELYSGYFSVKHLARVKPEIENERGVFELQNLEVKTDKVSLVISELSRRGIMFIQTKSEDEGYQMIYFKAPHEVFIYISYEIL